MNAARSLPVLDVLAVNDNALDDDGVLTSNPRARAALSVPLRSAEAIPAAACRRFHTVHGKRVLSSIVAVEWFGGAPRWRASVTIWGRANAERREIALLLTEQLLAGVGVGPSIVEQGASTTILRRALSPRERAALTAASVVVAVAP